MISNLIHRTKAPEVPSTEPKGLAIGETDAHVFNCPACARPLSEGTSKCPGCGARLVMGVRLKRAGAILALGVVVGVLIGGVSTAAAITLGLADPAPALAVVPSAAPSAAPSPTAMPSYAIENPLAPVAAVSALSGTAVVNGRIAVDAKTLSNTLARSNATTTEIARALRSLAADAALGIDLAGRLATWPDASPVQTALDDFYRSMSQTARTGLRYSLADPAGYRAAGAAMLDVLATLGPVDALSRTLAETVDLELPPVALP
jgi:hypothetical protein